MTALIVLNATKGIRNPYNWQFCQESNFVSKNLQICAKYFEHCFVINDSHDPACFEFKYLPPHSIKTSIDSDVEELLIPKISNLQILQKTTLSPFMSEHNRNIVFKSCNNFCVAGFNTSTDIVPTALSLLDLKKDVFITDELCGDISMETKHNSLRYLNLLGIPIVRLSDVGKYVKH